MGGLHTPGKILRDAREDRGYSVKELAAITRIAPKHIEALEADHYDNFPAEVFAQGFIRNCARELELDADALINSYREHRGLEPLPQVVDDTEARDFSIEELFENARLPRLSYFFAVLAILLGLGLALVIFGQPQAQQLTEGIEGPEVMDVESP